MADELISEMELPEQPVLEEQETEISQYSKQGYMLLKENKIDEAKEAFSKILAVEDNNNYALVGLGDCERKQNHIDAALDFYTKCLEFHPGNNYALFGLADCYKAKFQFHKAIEIWEKYLLLDDRNITVLTRVADAYRKIKDFNKSRELYLHVLDMEKDNAYALIGLGHLHYDFKEYRDALYYWTRIYDMSETTADIRVLTAIGNCHRKLKTFEQGIKFFEMALQHEPNNFYALFGLADCYRGLNLQNKSVEYWNRILEIDPKNKIILTRVGDAYRKMQNFKLASEFYNRAMDIDFDIYAALGLALIAKDEGRFEDAVNQLSALLKNEPKNYRLYLDLSDCYLKMNDKSSAIKVLKNFLSLGVKSSLVSEKLLKLEAEKETV